ncbi:signal transduction histidine kinase [Nakamurella sp. UYEF19]|uniref:sensor histidine kinase n=1 Tax=Nakamurella sp. UYEF19 TaxID=1756392 RepID=UPI0033963331
MSDTDSLRVNWPLGCGWVLFAAVNAYLTFLWAGAETIPYHLIWASFAFLYGLYPWPRPAALTAFWIITVVTGTAFVHHAIAGIIAWSECSEIVLMGVILALLMWHVERQRATRRTLVRLQREELERAQNRELRSRFGTHEVRTRLAIARGFVELIGAATIESEIRSDAHLVLGELDKASVMVSSLLTLAQVSEPSVRAPMDIKALIETALHRWVSNADRQWTSSAFQGHVAGDPERLEAALDCLIENAVKFTEPGDSIDISCTVVGGALMMAVTDSGAGIPPDEIDRVFEMFKTSRTAGERAGSGLGLAIVKAMAEARRGSVSVQSTLGVGSRFTVRIPLGDGELAPAPSLPVPTPAGRT